MAEERSAEISRPHEECLVDVVPAKKCFDGQDELGDRVAGLGLADDPGVLQIFADLHGDETEILANGAARNPENSPGLKLPQVVVVLRQAAQAWLRNGPRFRPIRSEERR